MIWYKDRFGRFKAVSAFIKSLFLNDLAHVPNPQSPNPLYARKGTFDQNVYEEIFLNREYEIDFGHPKIIIDAGAHVGYASVFFATRYPDAKIIAIEPEDNNFNLLQINTTSFANISPIKAGLWNCNTFLKIDNPDADNWSFRVIETKEDSGFFGISLPRVMQDFGIEKIDILKIDIEGSEIEILNDHHLWLPQVDNIIIELHDRFRPGCKDKLEEALTEYSYNRFESGESVVIRNITPKTS